MSVVVGIVGFDGVLITADSRVSYPDGRGRIVRSDTCQKVFQIGSYSALGFVSGDTAATGRIVRHLLLDVTSRRPWERHPVRLLFHWLPRLFRRCYARLPKVPMSFLAASTMPTRPTRVWRRELLELALEGAHRHGRSPGFLLDLAITMQEAGLEEGDVPGWSQGVVVVYRAPQFEPMAYWKRGSTAIGSGGEAATVGLSCYRDELVAYDSPKPSPSMLDSAIASYVRKAGCDDVGGLYPVYRITSEGVRTLGRRLRFGSELSEEVSLQCGPDGRWVQRSTIGNKVIPLVPPWALGVPAPVTFDDIIDFYKGRYRKV